MKIKLITLTALASLLLVGCTKETVSPILDEKTAFLQKARQFVQTQAPAADLAQMDWNRAVAYKKDSAYKMVRVPLRGHTQPGQKAVYLGYDNGQFRGNYFELLGNTVTTLSLDKVRKRVGRVTADGQVRDWMVYENGRPVQDATGMATASLICLMPPPQLVSFDLNTYYWIDLILNGTGANNGGGGLTANYLDANPDGSDVIGGGNIISLSQQVYELVTPLGLYYEQAMWLQQHPARAAEMHQFVYQTQYSDLNSQDKQELAVAHLNSLMTDPDYLEMVDGYAASSVIGIGHPWMLELFKELATEIGLKVLKKYLPGYGDWQSIKDALDAAGHGNWLSALGEVLNIVKKKVPFLAIFDAIIDVFDFGKLANKAWKAFDKLSELPTNVFEGLLKTIKSRCGGILGMIEHDNTLAGNSIQGLVKYTPSQSEGFFRELATNIGVAVNPTSSPTSFYFDMGNAPNHIRFNFYKESTSGGDPSIEIVFPTGKKYKLRFVM